MNIRSVKDFLVELEKVSSKFKWYLLKKEYNSITLNQIVGERQDDNREYIPLTAVVEETVGKYYDPSFFDKAAGEVFMSGQTASQIIDACDEWPDRLHGYKPKGYENKLRKDIIKICFEK
jgi:hypothetical protein